MFEDITRGLYYHELTLDDGGTLLVTSSSPELDPTALGQLAVVSGGYDPLHRGHIVNINEAARISGDKSGNGVVVIANGDRFLREKRKDDPSIPAPFMPIKDRLASVANLKPVVFAVESIDEDQTVCATLEALSKVKNLQIKWFANGGDRKAGNVPEDAVCAKIGVDMIYGCGTIKENSSSDVLKRAAVTAASASTKHKDTRWGHYCTLASNGSWATKSLLFAAKKGLSLQTHERRSESWHCVEGEGLLMLGALDEEGRQIFKDGMPLCGSIELLYPGRKIDIALGQAHMACSTTSQALSIHETWKYADKNHPSDESDIQRYGDPFNNPEDGTPCQQWLNVSLPLHTTTARHLKTVA